VWVMPLSPARVLRTFRYALFFDGVDDYINIPPSSSLALSSSFTLTAWLLIPQGVVRGNGVVQKNPQVNDYDYMLYLSTLGRPAVFFKNPAGTLFVAMYDADHRDGRWHFWTGVFDGRFLRMYVDAILRATTDTGGQTVRTSDTPLAVGYGWSGYARMYSACVLIYSRPLSASEISWNYSNPDNPVRNGLVLWLQAHPDNVKDIDGDGLLEWLDLSGNGNHGKIYGASLVELIRTPVR
jgi:hypothetical protein